MPDSLNALISVEVSINAIKPDLQAWARTKNALATTEGLAQVLNNLEGNLANQDQESEVQLQLRSYVEEATGLGRWVEANRAQLDAKELAKDLSQNPAESLQAWEVRARQYRRLSPSEDPRNKLQTAVQQDGFARQVEELRQAQKRGVTLPVGSPDLTQWTTLTQRLETLGTIPAVASQLEALNEGVTKWKGDYDAFGRALRLSWIQVFDLDSLVRDQSGRRLNDPFWDEIWQKAVTNAATLIRNGGGKPQPQVLLGYSKRLDEVWAFLKQAEGGMIDLWSGTDSPANDGDLQDFRTALSRRYGSRVLEVGIDTNRWQTSKPAEEVLESSAIREERKLVRSAWDAMVQLDRRFRDLSTQGSIPTAAEVGELKQLGALLTLPSISELVRSSSGSRARLVNLGIGAIAPRTWTNGAAVPSNSPEFRLQALLEAGVLEQNAGWEKAVVIAGRLKPLDPASRSPDWKAWLADRWGRVSPGKQSEEALSRWYDVAVSAGIPANDLPKGLVQGAGLVRLKTKLQQAADPLVANLREEVEQVRTALAVADPVNGGLLRDIEVVMKRTNRLGGLRLEELGPKLAGASIRPVGPDRLSVGWSSAEALFRLVDAGSAGRWWVSEREVSADQMVTWAGTPGALQVASVGKGFTDELGAFWGRDPLEGWFDRDLRSGDYRAVFSHGAFGLHQLEPVLNGNTPVGLRVRSPRFAQGQGLAVGEVLNTVTGDLPANFISPRRASEICRSLGCRLPSPEEWRVINGIVPSTGTDVRLSAGRREALQQYADAMDLAEARLVALMLSRSVPPVGEKGKAKPETLFKAVLDSETAAPGIEHWRGNVAEVLQSGTRFYLAGGSWAVPPGDSIDPVEIPDKAHNLGYADVGFRLMFDWKGETDGDLVRRLAAQLQPAAEP